MSTPFSSGSPYSDPGFSPPPRLNGYGDARATGLQRAVAILAWPMVLVGTLWFGFGHALLGGGGGWMVFIGLLFGAPIYGTVAVISAILVTVYARKNRRWAAGSWQTWAAVPFYLLTAFYPLTVTDFGDSGPALPSRLTAWFGVSQNTSGILMYSLWWIMSLVALLVIIGGIVDLVQLNQKLAAERFPQGGEFRPQNYSSPQPGYGQVPPSQRGYGDAEQGYPPQQPGYDQNTPYYPEN